MKGTREIRGRIRSVKSTAQITRAMELVASSKMKRAQDAATGGKAYALLLAQMMESIVEKLQGAAHPFFTARPVKKRGILVFSTDKGLCGALNANLFRKAADIKPGEALFVCVGKKATQYFQRMGHGENVECCFSLSDRVHFSEIKAMLAVLEKKYLAGEVDTIEVLYPAFLNTLRQDPILTALVPFTNFKESLVRLRRQYGLPEETPEESDRREMLFEPSKDEIAEAFPPFFLHHEVYQMALSAKASEHSARMVAMKGATDNADQLVASLTLEYNKARQNAITQEIIEISAAQSA